MLEDLLDPDPGTYFKTWELIAPLTWSPDNLVLQLFGDAQVESSMAGIYMNTRRKQRLIMSSAMGFIM